MPLSGRVVETGQLTPIRGATVEVAGVGRATTDAAGEFRFARVARGLQTVRVQALGYESLETSLVLHGDTTLLLQLQPLPLPLDPVGVAASTITVSGDVRDLATGRPVIAADVSLGGRETRTGLLGRFRVTRAPRGAELPLSVRALGYLPADVRFVAERDTSVRVALEVDPVAQRMIAETVQRIETRGRSLRTVGTPAIGREELLDNTNTSVFELLDRNRRLDRVRCILIDDIQSHRGKGELHVIRPHQLERIEFLERGRMLRLYTRDFIRRLMGGTTRLPSALYLEGGLAPFCR